MQHVPGHKSQSDDQAQLCTLTVQYVQMWLDNDVMNHGQVIMMMRIMGTVLAMMIMTMARLHINDKTHSKHRCNTFSWLILDDLLEG